MTPWFLATPGCGDGSPNCPVTSSKSVLATLSVCVEVCPVLAPAGDARVVPECVSVDCVMTG